MTRDRSVVVVYSVLSVTPVVVSLVTGPDWIGVVVTVLVLLLTLGLWAGSRIIWGVLLITDTGAVVLLLATGDLWWGLVAMLRLAVLISPPMRKFVGVGEERAPSAV